MEVFRQICYSSSSTFNPSAYSSLMLDLHHGGGGGGGGGGGSGGAPTPLEREHMFEKVVTPSDVGKLNRLVIPKQHAEKYFPLDPMSGDDKQGIHLCFEDRHGKHWQFRYSYWSSSQSYVMTKGWSRFVKDKQLDSGDTVSFSRAARHGRLFIDWRRHKHSSRRPLPASAGFVVPLHGGSGRRLFSSAAAVPPLYNAADLGRYFYHQLPVPSPAAAALVLESVPVPRRVRLFGVDLECSAMDGREAHDP